MIGGCFSKGKTVDADGQGSLAVKGAGAKRRRRMAHAETRLLVFLRDSSEYTRTYLPVMYRNGSILKKMCFYPTETVVYG
jgi:hypothetical protein